jgi:hypothetical protein
MSQAQSRIGSPSNKSAARPHRHTLPVRLSLGGCSFQFGLALGRSSSFDAFDIGVPDKDCDAIPFPHFVVEFCARHTLDDCSVRIERSQASFTRLIEAWFQNPKGQIGNAATDAVAAISHEK